LLKLLLALELGAAHLLEIIDMNLSELARYTFQTQLERMQLNLEGCIEGVDPIHLHDLRVANRRTRVALSEFNLLLPDEIFQKYQEDFRWIHQVTGPVRDLDVGLSHFPFYKKKISKNWRSDLTSARELLIKKRQAAQDELAVVLSSRRITEIFTSWSALLESDVLEGNQYALESAREFGCRLIIKRYRKTRKRGVALNKKSPAKRFHNLRLRVKKLRYLIEFFYPVLDKEEAGRLRVELKKVQDALGAFQDADVQIANLIQMADTLQDSERSLNSVLALGQLIGSYEKELRRSRKASLQAVRWLTSDHAARDFQGCFMYPVE
jgi:CHAD domain-containing protein